MVGFRFYLVCVGVHACVLTFELVYPCLCLCAVMMSGRHPILWG